MRMEKFAFLVTLTSGNAEDVSLIGNRKPSFQDDSLKGGGIEII